MDDLSHQIKIDRLFKKIQKIEKIYSRIEKKMKLEKKSIDDLRGLESEERNEIDLIEFEIESENTSYFLKKANRLFLEIPEYNNTEYWTDSRFGYGRKVLNNKAISLLRNKIREERKIKIEFISNASSMIIGLIGAIIGLIAILK